MQRQTSTLCKHLNDSLLSIFKTSSQVLKQSGNKGLYEAHNKLMNKILLVSQKDFQQTLRQILSHFLHFAQIKNSASSVIALLTKFIQFLKFYQRYLYNKSHKQNQQKQRLINGSSSKKQQQKGTNVHSKKILSPNNQLKSPKHELATNKQQHSQVVISQILTQIVDIILLIQNKSKANDGDTYLRIIQTTFSIIDIQFIQHMPYNLMIKIYSISFQCCVGNVMIQNISVSCLFSLTQTLFSLKNKQNDSCILLQNFLEYLFRKKRFSWIKDGQLKGIVWDLVVAGIKNANQSSLQIFVQSQANVQLINLMYQISAQKSFNSKFSKQKQYNSKQNTKKKVSQQVSINFKQDPTSQFIRCYKTFIVLSIQYSLNFIKQNPTKQQIVPFNENIRLFNLVYDLQRNWCMYIIIQGIFALIQNYPQFSINQQKGYVLFQIISKIAQQLCLSNTKISCQWTNEKSFLNKFYYGDLTLVNDGDFVKIIRNSIVNLRKNFQYMKTKQISNNSDAIQLKSTQQISSQRSNKSVGNSSPSNIRKRWEKFIKCIIKIIRYLSSISILSQTDEQPVRKIILQLQQWFLICPSSKIKNIILQQLLVTTSTLKSKQQAIKVSQCIQIASNLIYGYYDMLDSIGLTIIIKMMAGIKSQKQDGKQYQELEEVFNMSQKLYLQQRIVKNQKQFSTTIQAFVQCANSLVADLQQPSSSLKAPTIGKNPSQRYYKMIDYLLEKLNIVILQNGNYFFNEWNYLTGFWMSFCSNKNHQIQVKTIVYVGQVIQKLLQIHRQRQQQIISIYLQLSVKCTAKKNLIIQNKIVSQIKNYMPLLQNQQALMEIFKIIKIIQNQIINSSTEKYKISHKNQILTQQKKFIVQLSQLQEAFVKQGIFRIKKLGNLNNIVQGLRVLGNQKNEQYKILTLLWTVADHLRNLSNNYSNDSSPLTKSSQSIQNQPQSMILQYQNLWKNVFLKIQQISEASQNAQTKQSSMHTFTQIIAQSSPILKDYLLIQIYQKVFIQKLFVPLIQNLTYYKQLYQGVDISFKIDMVKAASKNYFKLTKKFILQNIFKDPSKNIEFSLQKLLKHIQALNNEHVVDKMPVQLMYEYLCFVQKLLNRENIDKSYLNQELVRKILKQLQKLGQKTDKTTIIWRKKYHPHLVQVLQNSNKAFSQPSSLKPKQANLQNQN